MASRSLTGHSSRCPQVYTLSEAPVVTTILRPHEHLEAETEYGPRLGSIGRTVPTFELRLIDERGHDVSSGAVGEIAVRSTNNMAGYWNNPAASAEALRNGWLHTGDVGSMDEDGFLTLKDRSKDVIISGGSNIYPREVEEVLLRHPAVSEVSVVGQADAEWGEVVVAFVVAQGSPPDSEELDVLCLDNIARFKRPKSYVFVDTLPKNNTGKVLKTSLRELLPDGKQVTVA